MNPDTVKHLESLTAKVAKLAGLLADANAARDEAIAAARTAKTVSAAEHKKALAAVNKAERTVAKLTHEHRLAHEEEEQQSLTHIRALQNAVANQSRIELLAQSQPEVAELFSQLKAAELGLKTVREQLAERDDTISKLKEQLAAALAPKKSE